MTTKLEGTVISGLQRTAVSEIPWRWLVIAVFVFSSALNFLDRQLLAAVAPMLSSEFGLSNTQYGTLISAFSLAYMLIVPITGRLIDRAGLNRGVMISVVMWSIAGAATGLAQTFTALLICRMALGIAETGGIPAASKVNATYLLPRELGIGHALQAGGVSIGAIVAPLAAAAIIPTYGWRSAFVFCGALGLLWVPLWWFTSKHIPPKVETTAPPAAVRAILADRRIWALLVTNVLIMTVHSLWSNWTTLYFVQERHLTLAEANRHFAWVPPVFATFGGFFGGWLSFNSIRRGSAPVAARLRMCSLLAPALLITAAIPFVPSAAMAAVVMGFSFFFCLALLTNLHVIPLDLFGMKNAAFTTSLLGFSYSLLQVVISPVIGAIVDNFGFTAVFVSLSVLPLAGVTVLRLATKDTASAVANASRF